ncbi:unnamed protein product [Absidia cylindrospora]
MKIPTEPTPNLVQVTNIGKDTTQASLRDFFAFCGKIKDFELAPADDQQKALILFETEKAAKTAELLSNALVENNHIQVQPYFQKSTTTTDEKSSATTQQVNASDVSLIKEEAEHQRAEGGGGTSPGAADEQQQDKKTVSNIMAELLSSGYILGDQVLAKGIDFDHRYGVREKVQHYFDQIRQNLQQWNEQYRVTDKANQMEQKMGLQQKQKDAQDWLQNNPTGQKVSGLISQFSQHITDLHSEARRLVSVRQNEAQQQKPSTA